MTIAHGNQTGNYCREGDHRLRLTILFLLLTLLAVYALDNITTPRTDIRNAPWPDTVYVRLEGKFCPLYFPADQLQ